MRPGDLVCLEEEFLGRDGYFSLWDTPSRGADRKQVDVFSMRELALVIEVDTQIEAAPKARILSPRGVMGWISSGNLNVVGYP